MAGDQISAATSYYYKDPVTNGTGNNLTASILTAQPGWQKKIPPLLPMN